MRILFLTHSFNSLTQRLFAALRDEGHEVSVELDIADSISEEAAAMFEPDLIVAPFLKRAIPVSIWQRHVCLVVHPGIVGDRGPSALDWAIVNHESAWGVTVLQANGEMDAGDIWAQRSFPMRIAKKSSLYRNEVTLAALGALLEAVQKFSSGTRPKRLADFADAGGRSRPLLRQAERRIDWQRDDSTAVLAKIHSADGFPGVLDSLFDTPCYLYDAHPATAAVLDVAAGVAGQIVGRRDHAVLRRTINGGLWIGHARLLQVPGGAYQPFKLPVADCFPSQIDQLLQLPVDLMHAAGEWSELRYWEEDAVGFLSFDFYNGAMSTEQCRRLRAAVQFAKDRPTRMLVLMGGEDFFSNGLHLNRIEAAAHRPSSSAADESWNNINAMNDVALEILTVSNQITVSALRGNAGAGGVFLALAADLVWAHENVLLNPHYKNMGNLHGSEYWTYLLPKRVGSATAHSLMQNRTPLTAPEAVRIGLIDAAFDDNPEAFSADAKTRALAFLRSSDFAEKLEVKNARRARDEANKQLQAYRDEELTRMKRNFYGFDPSYHVARYHFVHKIPHAWTPRHLAIHRNVKVAEPST